MGRMFFGPLACAMVVALAMAGMAAMGIHTGWSSPLTALGAGILASLLGVLPLQIRRAAPQTDIMQAGLMGTLLHMLVLVGIAAAAMFGHLPVGPMFVGWIFAVYLVTLVCLVIAINRVIRAAPMESGKV